MSLPEPYYDRMNSIQELLDLSGLSPAEAGSVLGVSERTIYLWRSHGAVSCQPDDDRAATIRQALEVMRSLRPRRRTKLPEEIGNVVPAPLPPVETWAVISTDPNGREFVCPAIDDDFHICGSCVRLAYEGGITVPEVYRRVTPTQTEPCPVCTATFARERMTGRAHRGERFASLVVPGADAGYRMSG